MSDIVIEPETPLSAIQKPSAIIIGRSYLVAILSSPLWVCLLVAVLARVWLIIHTHGVMDGDEATVGIQAEHILHGEFPVYYYGQAYLGNIQAYVIALLFLITGPAVWSMRIEPILTSILIVYLTWRFAAALADGARLSWRARILFMTVAALVAALAPLYDVVEEMRVTGGYIEAFAIMLWLLLCAFRLTQRWSQHASQRELAGRWLGLGLLIGLGLWIDPLIVYAYVSIVTWIGGYFFIRLLKRQTNNTQSRLMFCREALLCLCALPTAVLGFTPGLIWGAQNNWTNLTYMLQNGGSVSGNRLHTILEVQKVYTTCLAPRALGGALPTQPDVTASNPHILTFGLVVMVCGLVLSVGSILFSFYSARSIFSRIRQLTLLPLLFLLCTSAIFCFASISTAAIYSGCGPVDYVGRYVVALVICLPFFVAAMASLPWMTSRAQQSSEQSSANPPGSTSRHLPWLIWIQGGMLIVLALYFVAQGAAYFQADPDYTFHPTGCVAENPTEVTPLIHYMEQAGIRYAWASSWIGNRITFATNGAIIATDMPGRVPANSQIVLRQVRPSIFLLARHTDPHPAFLQMLDANHVTYHVVRFYSEPSVDVLLVTPLNRTVSPLDPAFASQMGRVLIGCV